MSRLESRLGVLCLLLAALLGCSKSIPNFHESTNPQRLSEWNLFALSQEELIPSEASLVFTPANQLFTDYWQYTVFGGIISLMGVFLVLKNRN